MPFNKTMLNPNRIAKISQRALGIKVRTKETRYRYVYLYYKLFTSTCGDLKGISNILVE